MLFRCKPWSFHFQSSMEEEDEAGTNFGKWPSLDYGTTKVRKEKKGARRPGCTRALVVATWGWQCVHFLGLALGELGKKEIYEADSELGIETVHAWLGTILCKLFRWYAKLDQNLNVRAWKRFWMSKVFFISFSPSYNMYARTRKVQVLQYMVFLFRST